MDNAISKANFLSRLSAVQKLCSDTDSNFPKALLFIPGQDGRNNRGSITLLKYLFKGCVSKELFDETLDSENEVLEDMVILVKQSSLSVVWSREMRKLLSPLCSWIPHLVEYISSEDEEKEIDSLQARKCCDFKRMMLESVREGEGVGVPVPIGYDDIQDIEGWPLIQAFALDQNYCSTGFFTARYTIADVTQHLESLFRTVDGHYVDNAIFVLNKTVKPHMLQAISMLDASTSEQRARVTGDDAIGPLEMLYDFGEMEVAGTCDPITKPVVLFGADTAQFAASTAPYSGKWKTAQAGNSLHALIEACEPSTGMRWCRTYFLKRGKAVDLVSDHDAVVKSAQDADEEQEGKEGEEKREFKSTVDLEATRKYSIPAEVVSGLRRLEALYVKLWVALRSVVRTAFASHTDVLEAGAYIQERLEYILQKRTAEEQREHAEEDALLGYCHSALGEVVLSGSERLQVHLDTMNAVGDIVTIEDVDDMGGSCWAYVRVSVHGIGAGKSTVAVGDTFLFAALSSASRVDLTHSLDQVLPRTGGEPLPLLGDAFCITHPLPYYRCFLGGGLEEKAAGRLISCSKSANMLGLLGLGKQLDHAGSGYLSLPILTDHPAVPIVENADVRIFSDGFLVEKMDVTSIPLMVSIGTHVERAWVVDSAECMEQAVRAWPQLKFAGFPAASVPAGLLIVFRLKSFEDGSVQVNEDGSPRLFQYNPLERALPFLPVGAKSGDHTTAPHHVAIFVKANSRFAAAMTGASSAWRVACRVHDIQEHRGGEVSLPSGILRAFVTALDVWGYSSGPTGSSLDRDYSDAGSISTSDLAAPVLLSTGAYCRQNPAVQVPGLGFLPMRCVHSLSDAQRLSSFDFESVLHPSEETANPASHKAVLAAKKALHKREAVLLLGHAGSGVQVIGSQLASQLGDKLAGAVISISVDLTSFHPENNGQSLEAQLNKFLDTMIGKQNLIGTLLVVVTLSATLIIKIPELLTLLTVRLSYRFSSVVSVVSPTALQLHGRLDEGFADKQLSESHYGLGQEKWRAALLQVLEPTVSDVVVSVDDASAAQAYAGLRNHLTLVNPAAGLVRVTPNALRLDDEAVESLVVAIKAASSSSSAAVTAREACRVVSGYPADYLAVLRSHTALNLSAAYTPQLVGVGPASFTVSPPAAENWNLSNVIKTLKLLFPGAKVCTTAIEDTWKVPAPKNGSGVKFGRLLDLARAKVLTVRQGEHSQRFFDEKSSALCTPRNAQLKHIIRGLRSIHGRVVLRGGFVVGSEKTTHRAEDSLASVEVCAGYIVIRPVGAESQQAVNRLTVQGVLSKEDRSFVEQLFEYCVQQRLPRKDRLAPADMTTNDLLVVQGDKRYSVRPLPGNVWFDGQTYLDINGARSVIRPDIDELVREYVRDENKKIEEYNDQLVGY